MKPHVNLIIATPGHSVQGDYLKSLLAAIAVLAQKGVTWAYSIEYSSHVAVSREMTLNGSGEMNLQMNVPFNAQVTYDKILWIDSDITFTPEDVIKAYESDYDIVSGAYMLSNGQVMAYEQSLGLPYTYDQIKEATEPIQVKGAGMGFMCVKQGVFESFERPWFQTMEVVKDLDDGRGPTPIQIAGEDLSFCERAMRNGYEIWLDPNIKLIHNKMMKITWDGPMP